MVPIVNENDTVVTDEIRLGDNDTLGALVTNLIEADTLVILTDQRGLYDSDPRKNPDAKFISRASGRRRVEAMAGGAGSGIGTGGMLTKVLAAKRAGAQRRAYRDRLGPRARRAPPGARRVHRQRAAGGAAGMVGARNGWPITMPARPRDAGRRRVQASAARRQDSLPIGVTAVDGEFGRGDVVACVDSEGRDARGLINYSAADTRRILRQPSSQIARILGSMTEPSSCIGTIWSSL